VLGLMGGFTEAVCRRGYSERGENKKVSDKKVADYVI